MLPIADAPPLRHAFGAERGVADERAGNFRRQNAFLEEDMGMPGDRRGQRRVAELPIDERMMVGQDDDMPSDVQSLRF